MTKAEALKELREATVEIIRKTADPVVQDQKVDEWIANNPAVQPHVNQHIHWLGVRAYTGNVRYGFKSEVKGGSSRFSPGTKPIQPRGTAGLKMITQQAAYQRAMSLRLVNGATVANMKWADAEFHESSLRLSAQGQLLEADIFAHWKPLLAKNKNKQFHQVADLVEAMKFWDSMFAESHKAVA